MSGPPHTREFWQGRIVDWLRENAGLRKERIDLTRKFTQEPYNLSAVRVLTMMDEFVALHNAANGTRLVLSQNWRLAQRSATVGDFIAAFLRLVHPDDSSAAQDAAKDNGASPSGQMSQSRQGGMQNQRIAALRANPGGDWKPVDLEIIASQHAMKFRKITGTHEVFLHPSVPHCVTVPLKSKIRAPHIRAFVAMIDHMDEAVR
ncbi:hypothetical protein LQG66_15720 [Bradyrhizobium ontarionense]|uniref:Uncharacterized protein n=1 Tax=Bradyrhizobium ontarionense TaxID=2898149 RepID=A0ABY3RJJ1_9BRAD|nr:hypothetical protein [Bradyrhizobium sp. A19]UFZ07660.1 hypothetical protein LQG66_15720 [Bradyrhizobium sp. A19]